jgi:hypothetical protein
MNAEQIAINHWNNINIKACQCDATKHDVRGRCQPEDATFGQCGARVDTAVWLIENHYAKLEDFEFLGAKIQYLIQRMLEEEEE